MPTTLTRPPSRTRVQRHQRLVGVRPATIADIPNLVTLETVWPEGARATEEQWESRIRIFPEGTLVAVLDDGSLCGVVSSLIVSYDLHRPTPTWGEVTDEGMITNHDPAGNVLYGVDLSVRRGSPPETSTALLVTGGRIAVRRRLEDIVLGARIPGYKRYQDVMKATDYVRLSLDNVREWTNTEGECLNFHPDPELVFYRRHGLQFIVVLSDYFTDPDSLNYGAVMRWPNFFRGWPVPSQLCARLLTIRTAQGPRGFLPQR